MIGFSPRYRVALLQAALRAGVGPFIRQAWLIGADRLRQKELIYRLDASEVTVTPPDLPPGLRFHEVTAWDDLPEDFRTRVTTGDFQWNGRDWFGKRRLWVGTVDGTVATLGWWCDTQETALHFFSIPVGAELLIHAATLPEFRGHNLHSLLRITCMQERVRQGTKAFYVHCLDYNTPSRRNIERMGFRPVGHTLTWRFLRSGSKRIHMTADTIG